MGVTLTTVTAGTPISWTALRSYIDTIETYVNEGIAYADLKASSPWIDTTRVFRPEFNTGVAPNAVFTSGETHWRTRSHAGRDRVVRHPEINTPSVAGTAGSYIPVDGLTFTVQTPTGFSSGGAPQHRALLRATWFAHEAGGDGTVDETTDRVGDFVVMADGTEYTSTESTIYTATSLGRVMGVACKQYSVAYPIRFNDAGVHGVAVRLRLYAKTTTGATDDWRHVFVWGRSAFLRWFLF